MKKTVLIFTGILAVIVITGYASKNIYFLMKDSLKTEQTSKQASQEKFFQKTKPRNGTSQNNSPNQKPKPPVTREDVSASSEVGSLSNKKYGWGVIRNRDHLQPEMPASILQTLAQNNAYWIGSPDEKAIYLTFDLGYENGYTPGILDILKKQNVKAAFFINGHYLKTQPGLVKRMIQEGHIVGNHMVNHSSMPDLTSEQIKEEIEMLTSDFTALTGIKEMVYFRPPKGEYSERTLSETKNLGCYTIFWSFAMADWIPLPGGSQEAYQTLMDNLHNGGLILLHTVTKDNLYSLDQSITEIKSQRYTFKTLDDLVKN
ncbi:MAG: Delta-lactam-biosynthetic de-N-acetylase [Desulfotomaculum sp. 46_296]|nr:MAG: Delta-lactam-biosynthetic de-N-acetylase [Desulfotomaculum sp. 46_296]KUK84472.1 MAG: Delta-lactam-biosynthetic de-N-acetylase [Desulfofundulus kuznetsovii]